MFVETPNVVFVKRALAKIFEVTTTADKPHFHRLNCQ